MRDKLCLWMIIIAFFMCGIHSGAVAAEYGTLYEDGSFYYEIKEGRAYVVRLGDSGDGGVILPDYVEDAPVVGFSDNYSDTRKLYDFVELPVFFEKPLPEYNYHPYVREWRVRQGNLYYDVIDGVLVNNEHTMLCSYPRGRQDTVYRIPEGITAIYESSFNQYYNEDVWLEKIEFPTTLHYIGEHSFRNQTKLTGLKFNEGLIGIGDYAFAYCRGLRYIILPDDMEYIGKSAFLNCAIEELTLPKNLNRAEEKAFSCNYSLEKVVIPAGVKYVNSCCFGNNTKLTSVSFSNDTIIADDAFYGCTSLTVGSEATSASADDFAGGDGSKESPYLIANEEQLKNIEKDLGASYRLINDIELSDEYDYVISDGHLTENRNSTQVFHGIFDGDGHTISRLAIRKKSDYNPHTGLFGYIRHAEIRNLNVLVKQGSSIDVAFDSNTACSGIICGYNDGGTIENCNASGVLSAESTSGAPVDKYRVAEVYAGGIAGYNKGIIKDCVSVVSADYNYRVLTRHMGGVCGYNSGTVTGCTARLNQSTYALYNCIDNSGGITDINEGSISDCYADGDMVIIVPSYYGTFGYSGARGEECKPRMAGIAVTNSGALSDCVFNGSIAVDFTEDFYKSLGEFVRDEDKQNERIREYEAAWLDGICADNSGDIISCSFNAEQSPQVQGTDGCDMFSAIIYTDKKSALDELSCSARLHEIRVQLNGKDIDFDVQPKIIDERTLVPIRAIFEALGMSIEWNENTQTVTAVSEDNLIVIIIGDNSLTVGDKTVPLDVPAMIIDGRTLVPVRAIAESTGRTVGWNGDKRLVTIQ